MNQKTLTVIGLILGMIGVVFIFIWGPPQPIFSQGSPLLVGDNNIVEYKGEEMTVAERDNIREHKRIVHSVMSKIGLGLVFIGFACQLGAIFLPTYE